MPTIDDRRAYFRMLVDGEDIRDVHPEVQVADIAISDDSKKLDKLSFKLPAVSLAFLESEYLQEDHDLYFEWGVVNEWTLSQDFRISELEYSLGTQIDVSIACVTRGTALAIKKTGAVWNGKTASEIAEAIAERHGMEKAIVPTKTRLATVAQGFRSYMAMLQDLAEDEGYVVRVVSIDEMTDALVFQPIAYNENPLYTYNYRTGADRNDVVSFNVRTKSTGVKGAASGAKTESIDERTGKKVAAEADVPLSSGVADVSATYEKGGGYEVGIVTASNWVEEVPNMERSHTSDPDALKKRMDSVTAAAKWKRVEGSLVVINKPLEANRRVRVTGAGTKLSGDYLCTAVSWKLNNGQWVATGTVKKDAPGSSDSKKDDAKKKEAGSADSQETADSRVTATYNQGGGYTTDEGGAGLGPFFK